MMTLGSRLHYARLSLIVVFASSSLSSVASAADVREYGAFTVSHEQAGDSATCKLIIEHSSAGKFFRLSVVKFTYLNMVMIYSSDLDELRGREASLQVGGQQILRLSGNTAKNPEPVMSMHPEKEADRIVQ